MSERVYCRIHDWLERKRELVVYPQYTIILPGNGCSDMYHHSLEWTRIVSKIIAKNQSPVFRALFISNCIRKINKTPASFEYFPRPV